VVDFDKRCQKCGISCRDARLHGRQCSTPGPVDLPSGDAYKPKE
jgi:hypothetical protein